MSEEQPEKVEEKSNPVWQCRIQASDVRGSAPLDNLYVGDKYLLRCEGEFVEAASDKMQLKPKKPEGSYGVHVLSFRTFENTGFWADATSYKPGPQSLGEYQLVYQGNVVDLQGGEIQIKSALAELPPEQMNKPEAMKMTMIGPLALSMPWWYWAGWFLIFALVFGVIARWVYRKLQRKKILEDLARQATALTPYNQFNKEIREQMRKYTATTNTEEFGPSYMRDLDQSFRMYLLRELLVPANEWSTGAVMRDIKNRHKKVYKSLAPQVRRTLVEFDRARRDPGAVSFEDCEQMRDMSRRAVDSVYRIKRLDR